MGPEIFVIALVALFFPILLLLGAVLLDVLVVMWVGYRWGHDSAAPAVEQFLHRRIGAPVSRFAHAHHLLPRPH